jgi:hypothetical protein
MEREHYQKSHKMSIYKFVIEGRDNEERRYKGNEKQIERPEKNRKERGNKRK